MKLCGRFGSNLGWTAPAESSPTSTSHVVRTQAARNITEYLGESGTVRRILQPVRDANEGTLCSELGHTVYGLRQCALGSVGPMRYRMTEARMIGLGAMLRATGVLLRAALITM